MGEQGVFLKNRVKLPAVRRQLVDILTVKDNIPGIRSFKTSQYTQNRGFPAAAGAQQCK